MTAKKSAGAAVTARRTDNGEDPMPAQTITDLGAHGTVTAGKFAVDVELGAIPPEHGGTVEMDAHRIITLDQTFDDIEEAEVTAASIASYAGQHLKNLGAGLRPVVQAYVVTADGTVV